MGIQRYAPVLAGALGTLPKKHSIVAMMQANADGHYVLHTKHEEVVAGLVRALERMVEQFTGSIETLNDQDAIDEAYAALTAHKP